MFVNLPTFFGALVLQFKIFASAANEEEFGFAIARVSLQATTKSPQGEEAAQGSDDDDLRKKLFLFCFRRACSFAGRTAASAASRSSPPR